MHRGECMRQLAALYFIVYHFWARVLIMIRFLKFELRSDVEIRDILSEIEFPKAF